MIAKAPLSYVFRVDDFMMSFFGEDVRGRGLFFIFCGK